MDRSRISSITAALVICLLGCVGQAGCGVHRAASNAHSAAGAAATGQKLVFNRDIEPILSQNCYGCHGPDPGGRKAGLRLDRPEFAFASHEKSGPPIVPNFPDRSPLVKRAEARDAKSIMPPPEAHKSLDPRQIALLRRWVREGAQYQEHWSFIPPARPPVPATKRTDFARNEIDRFILARLEREGMAPSPEADRSALIRRVTYDLTGLPPTPDEADRFLRDASPGAYEKVVDRLLASPRYGEHRAHYWLDAARFGDTHGVHLDNYRSIWPYRDYVIKSYNENKPFDQFIREQLAGDLLPPVDLDQIVATAFIRAGVSSGEGGTIVEELRVNNQRERVEAFGAVFMGMTTGCAVCHDHKFDPISQRDFYRLTAFFNNLEENPSNDDREDWPPFILVPKLENRAAYDAKLARRAAVQRQIDARWRGEKELVAEWLKERIRPPQPVPTTGLAVRLRLDEERGVALANSAPTAAFKSVTAAAEAPVWGEEMRFWPSLRMDTGTRISLPSVGDHAKDQPFSVGAWLMPRLRQKAWKAPPQGAIVARIDSIHGSRGWELFAEKGKLSFRLVHRWPDDAICVETEKPVLAGGRWNHVFATYDGSGKASGARLYLDGQAQPVAVIKDALAGDIRAAVPLEFGRESADASPMRQSRYQDFRFYDRELPPAEAARVAFEDVVEEIVRLPAAQWNEDQAKVVADFYFTQRDDPTRELRAQRDALDAELGRLSAGGDICLVCAESPRLAYADTLVRGVYSQRLERVRAGVPHFLPPLPAGAPLNRLGLAEWVVSPSNPLTARVAVNRMWQEIFGTGIVETTEDFGLVGDRPSHPELLDWLAVDFRESGWNVKRFYKQIVMSATYRESARVTPELMEKDPHNRLLARGARFRMDAEMLRDTGLAASGLFVNRIGGPSVKPYQPEGVWEAGAFNNDKEGFCNTASYTRDHGEALYRRSLYTFWKRMATMPDMDMFDAPVRDSSCTRRQRTNTPLQALVVMNDPQWLEAARCLAERVFLHAPTTEARLDYLGRLLLARSWQPKEKAVLEAEYENFHSNFAGRTKAATDLIAQGESRPNPAIAAAELAPWMMVASTALDLDVTMNK